MEQIKDTDNVKLCVGCDKVKPLDKVNFGKVRTFYNKYCRPCYNLRRKLQKCAYVKVADRPGGKKKRGAFEDLPKELQDKIIYHVFVKCRTQYIFDKYKNDYPNLRYQRIVLWRRNGKIPKYVNK